MEEHKYPPTTPTDTRKGDVMTGGLQALPRACEKKFAKGAQTLG